MAEVEIGIMSRQALGKPLPDLESFKQQIRTWTIRCNAECAKINWQFKAQDVRIKLARLYPVTVWKLHRYSTRECLKIKKCTKPLFPFLIHAKIKKKGADAMLRRYELTDQEWEQVASLLPP